MAVSLAAKAARRVAGKAAAAREAFAQGRHRDGLNRALDAVRSELAHICDTREGDGPLARAAVAARLFLLAEQMATFTPPRPDGCPALARAEDLVTAFDTQLAKARAAGGRRQP